MRAAVGMIPSAAVTKIADADAFANSSTSAIGISGVNRYGRPSPVNSQRARERRSGEAAKSGSLPHPDDVGGG
jgi:hypothetical protein